MEFMNRGVRQQQPVESPEPVNHQSVAPRPKQSSSSGFTSKGMRIAQVVLLSCITILIVAALILLATNDNKTASADERLDERLSVDSSKLQAVFLVNGQVYFGKIKDLNKEYLKMSDIYYLRVNQQVQPGQPTNPNDITLAKLGCELHRPQDSMVINRAQVVFWENLKDDASEQSVPGAVKKYKEANPGEQKCETAQTNTNNNTTPAPSPTPAPTPATNNNNNRTNP